MCYNETKVKWMYMRKREVGSLKGILRTELKRAFHNKYLLFALIIGFAISVWQTVEHVIPLLQYQTTDIAMLKGAMPHTVFNKWMGGHSYFLQTTLYYIIVPLLATIPFGASFYQDRRSGYLKNIFTRTDKKKYYRSKYTAVFLSGGFVGVAPLLFNFLTTALLLPLIYPEVTAGTFVVHEQELFATLYYTNPYLYLLFYLVMDFVFFGILATIALAVGQYVNNYFVVLLTPFLFYVLFMFLSTMLGFGMLNMTAFLQPAAGSRTTLWAICIEAVVLAVIAGVLFFIKRKEDVY